MILSSIHHFCHSKIGQTAGVVLANGVAYGVDGAVVGVALGVLATIGMGCVASMSKDKSAGAGLAYMGIGAIALGGQYGATAGVVFGLGKGILAQVL